MPIKKRLIRGFLWLVALFVLLFVIRLLYGYTRSATIDSYTPSNEGLFNTFKRSNYASAKIAVKETYSNTSEPEGMSAHSSVVEQKYEKVASLATKSKEFEKDEQATRSLIHNYNAVVQYEQNTGLQNNRLLYLVIGVKPDSFDVFVAKARGIGDIQSITINKTDKTSEFKELNAKRAALEKTRESYLQLKSRNAPINDLIVLESKILETEQQLQNIGVNLGQFKEENEFCTVKLMLSEASSTTISFRYRLRIALRWTVDVYPILLGWLFFMALTIVVIEAAWRAVQRIMQRFTKEKNND